MNPLRIAALALIVAGLLALGYGGFSYTRETHQTRIGPVALSVSEKESVNIPVWLGLSAVVCGVALLLLKRG